MRTGYRATLFEHEVTVSPTGNKWHVTVKDPDGDLLAPAPDLQSGLDLAKARGCQKAVVSAGMSASGFNCDEVRWIEIQLPD